MDPTLLNSIEFVQTYMKECYRATSSVYYNSTTYELNCLTSSLSTKKDVIPLSVTSAIITGNIESLKPYNYKYILDPDNVEQIGYITEEVKLINPNFVNYNTPGGDPVSINYDVINIFLVEEVKRLTKQLNILESNYNDIISRLTTAGI